MKPPHPLCYVAILILCLPAAAPGQDVRSGLVSYWPLETVDGGSGTTPELVAGSHLTLVNMDGENIVPGMRGNALIFNGSNELAFTNTNDGRNPRLPIHNNPRKTICLWVKGFGADRQVDKRIFAEGSMTSTSTLFTLGTENLTPRTGKLATHLRTGGNITLISHTETALEPFNDEWHHVAMTDDNGSISYYIDGVADTTLIRYAWSTLPLNTLSLGAIQRMGSPTAYFSGTIDDVALWNRVLSPAEINEVMMNGLAVPIPPLLSVDRAGPYLQGDRVKLSVQFNAASPTYQWQRNGTPIPGATESSYIVPALTQSTDGNYSVLVNSSLSDSISLAFTPDPAVALPNNIVSAWPFNSIDTAGLPATTPDLWGGHALQCQEMDAGNLVAGRFGNALDFDGLTEHAFRTTGFAIGANPEFSVAFWVKANANGQLDSRVFGEGSNTNALPLFTMGTATDNSPRLQVLVRSDGGTALISRLSTSPVFDDTWHHVVWAEKSGRVRLYVDGLMDPTNFDYSRTGQTLTLNQTAVAALQRSGTGNRLKSTVDDVALWTRALTWSEVQSIYNAPVPAPVTVVAPAISADPVSRVLWEGRSVSLSVQATGTGPLEYEWLKEGAPVPSATEATLVFNPAGTTQSGTYTVRVRNSAGDAISRPAVLNVRAITSLQSGSLSLWPLESLAGTTTADLISGHDLTLVNMDPAAAFGAAVQGNGAVFDGANDHMVHTYSGTGADAPLTTRDEFTITFWVKGNGLGQSDRRVFAEASTFNSNSLFNMGTDLQGASQNMAFFIKGDSGTLPVNQQTMSIRPVFDGLWHHVIYTDNKGLATLYVDGTVDRTFNYNRPPSTLTNMSLGAIARATPSHWFRGSMDEVKVWERAITGEEASGYYDSLPKPPVTFAVIGIELVTATQLAFTVATSLGSVDYRVQSTTNITTGPWMPVDGAFFTMPENGILSVVVPFNGGDRKFYRITTGP